MLKSLEKKKSPKIIIQLERNKKAQTIRLTSLRYRGFRQAVIETYDCKCAICGLKIYSPKTYQWETEAAHIVPHSNNGKDDIWNGISLCRFHHWAFDVGWFGFDNKLQIVTSEHLSHLPIDMGKVWNFDLIRKLSNNTFKVHLPENQYLWSDLKAIQWHRENVLQKT